MHFLLPAIGLGIAAGAWQLVIRPSARHRIGFALYFFLPIALLSIGWTAKLIWFPSVEERLGMHGETVPATVVKVTGRDPNNLVMDGIPIAGSTPKLVPAVSRVEVQYDTPAGLMTADIGTKGNLDLDGAETLGVDQVVGAKTNVIFDPEDPRTARPAIDINTNLAGVDKDLTGFAVFNAVIAAVCLTAGRLWPDDKELEPVGQEASPPSAPRDRSRAWRDLPRI